MTRRGFTLIEVVVVLAILTLVLGVAIPRLVAPPTSEQAAARELADALSRARILAAERDEPVAMQLDTETGAWAIVTTADGDTLGRGGVAPGVAVGPRSPRIQTVRFDPLGRAAGPALTVGAPVPQHAVRVDRWTGVVSIANR